MLQRVFFFISFYFRRLFLCDSLSRERSNNQLTDKELSRLLAKHYKSRALSQIENNNNSNNINQIRFPLNLVHFFSIHRFVLLFSVLQLCLLLKARLFYVYAIGKTRLILRVTLFAKHKAKSICSFDKLCTQNKHHIIIQYLAFQSKLSSAYFTVDAEDELEQDDE